MRPRTIEFTVAQANPLWAPLVVINLTTPAGVRVYCATGVTDDELWAARDNLLDGSWTFDGSRKFGAQLMPVISVEPRVISYGVIRDTGSILPTIAVRGQRAREVGSMEITLDNADDHFGKVLAQDTLLSAELQVALGYRGVRRDRWLTRFRGVVQELRLTRDMLSLRAETA